VVFVELGDGGFQREFAAGAVAAFRKDEA